MSASLLAGIIVPHTILLAQELTSKKRVFEQVGLVAENLFRIGRAQVFDALFAREKLGSTALGQGVALPHGRLKGLKNPAAVLLRPVEPIPFDAPDGLPVTLIVALLVPAQATNVHLQLLSELAQMLSDRVMREKLMGSPSVDEIYTAIQEWRPYAADHRPEAV